MWKLLRACHVELCASVRTVRVSIFGRAKDVVVRAETYGAPIQNFLLLCLGLWHHRSGFNLIADQSTCGSVGCGKTSIRGSWQDSYLELECDGLSRLSGDPRT